MKKIAVERRPEFDKDIKKLGKKFKSIEDDLEVFIQYGLKLQYSQNKSNMDPPRLTGLGFENPEVYKVTKFACESLKKGVRSGIRIIYAYFKEDNRVELVEIYYKGNSDNENRNRIINAYKNHG